MADHLHRSGSEPARGTDLKKTLTARVPLLTTTGTPNASVWNYAYSTRAPGAGCEVDINGTNVVVDIPLYVTGDLCLSGTNVAIDEQGEGEVVRLLSRSMSASAASS